MKIVVIGGSGLIGAKLLKILRQRGREAVAASYDQSLTPGDNPCKTSLEDRFRRSASPD